MTDSGDRIQRFFLIITQSGWQPAVRSVLGSQRKVPGQGPATQMVRGARAAFLGDFSYLKVVSVHLEKSEIYPRTKKLMKVVADATVFLGVYTGVGFYSRLSPCMLF